jgi:hypothetical protein
MWLQVGELFESLGINIKQLSCYKITKLQTSDGPFIYDCLVFFAVYCHGVRIFLATYWPLEKIRS